MNVKYKSKHTLFLVVKFIWLVAILKLNSLSSALQTDLCIDFYPMHLYDADFPIHF